MDLDAEVLSEEMKKVGLIYTKKKNIRGARTIDGVPIGGWKR